MYKIWNFKNLKKLRVLTNLIESVWQAVWVGKNNNFIATSDQINITIWPFLTGEAI